MEKSSMAKKRNCEAQIAKRVREAREIRMPFNELLEKTKKDPGTPFKPQQLSMLANLKNTDRACFETLRGQLKNAGCRVTELDTAISEEIKTHCEGQPGIVSHDDSEKPRLLVQPASPNRTVAELRDILARGGDLFDRGVPVRLTFDQRLGATVAQIITPHLMVMLSHNKCRPRMIKRGEEINAQLPLPFARMYLDWKGEWKLPPLNGISTSPLLQEDGTIIFAEGYDADSGMWCENLPDLTGLIPDEPTADQAAAAFLRIREPFKTFCPADAPKIHDAELGIEVVDLSKPPGADESALLCGLLTAACRSSLPLAPAVMITSPAVSGAGSGKGLCARCISIIAFGNEPHAVTAGANSEELEKRIASELMQASAVLFLDNLNNTAFKSDLLASAITERPARVRKLGKSKMVTLNSSAFVLLTGNGLSVSEDLARRFIVVEFDPKMEDPEARPFKGDIKAELRARRPEILADLLTIWRWGRISNLAPGKPLGSFEQWGRWVRDPLIALGSKDPAERVSEAKHHDSGRQMIVELFGVWWQEHGDKPVSSHKLSEAVKQIIDPQNRSRQFLTAQLERLAGTRIAGFVLTRQASLGHWGAATYALQQTG